MQHQEITILDTSLTEALQMKQSQTIAAALMHYQKTFESLLTSYHYSERGAVQAIQVKPESITLLSANQIEIILQYQTQHRYACDGISHDFDKSMKITLRANPETQTLTFLGEYWPERDGEEF